MIQGLDISQRIEFSLSSDTTEPKTVFVLKPLTGPEKFEISSRFIRFGENASGEQIAELQVTAEYAVCVLKRCIVSVKNFGDGKPVDEIIDALQPIAIAELLTKCTSISGLTESERKN